MKAKPRAPLLVKMLALLCIHLTILALAFYVFVRWQLGFGLDSLLSGSAGERLAAFGNTVLMRMIESPPPRWNDEIKKLAQEKGLAAAIFEPARPNHFPLSLPLNVRERALASMPAPPAEGGPPADAGPRRPPPRDRFHPPGDPPPPPRHEPPDFDRPPPRGEETSPSRPSSSSVFLPKSRPEFLMRGGNGDGYWAGVMLHLPPSKGFPRRPVLLLIRADRLDGSGMFFDFQPWLLGGLAVLLLSLIFWTPFIWGITRYIHRLKSAADSIAAGRFQIAIPDRGNDELGDLGRTIEATAARLNHLISGQKRFLGDAAHELCAPLARIRTGLGVLEMKLSGDNSAALASIESDTAELAALVNEILAFSHAGNRQPSLKEIRLEPLLLEVVAKEAHGTSVESRIPSDLTVVADPTLLARAVGNLLRNAGIHAGPDTHVVMEAHQSTDEVTISVSDNGPGVPASELPRLFEPFYRLDRSRSRDTGGSGLGLAIVRTAIEACGGKATASLPENGGFRVTLHLPKQSRN